MEIGVTQVLAIAGESLLTNHSKCAASSEVKIMRKSQAGRLHTAPDMGRQIKEKEAGMFLFLSL